MVITAYLAAAGIASRRSVLSLVSQGLVVVNGAVIYNPAYRVLPTDKVSVGGVTAKIKDTKVYILLNKPCGYITTMSDEFGRKTVMDVFKSLQLPRLFPVGRLDRDSSGLLLMTNDGVLSQQLMHPSNKISKVYFAILDRSVKQVDLERMRQGIHLFDGFIKADKVVRCGERGLQIELHSGKNRIIRRMCEHFGYRVVSLDRIMLGTLSKKGLLPGQWRYLTSSELTSLRHYLVDSNS